MVVNDLNFEAATAVAREIGGYPRARRRGDRGRRAATSSPTARDCRGEIDIYCSNVASRSAPAWNAPEAACSSPGSSCRRPMAAASLWPPPAGSVACGCFVVTVLVAGPLTTLGLATYSVTEARRRVLRRQRLATYVYRWAVMRASAGKG